MLIEDLPGLGKTLIAKTLARSIGATFKRIQFTPDLLPADVTGFNVYNQQSGQFTFQPGPVLTHVLLADEINRTIPRTQASLLESMEERQVTVDGKTYPLPRPFFVLATQNPIEMEGTFPLPGGPARPVPAPRADRLPRGPRGDRDPRAVPGGRPAARAAARRGA